MALGQQAWLDQHEKREPYTEQDAVTRYRRAPSASAEKPSVDPVGRHVALPDDQRLTDARPVPPELMAPAARERPPRMIW